MTKTTIHILSALVAGAGALLAVADKVTAIPSLPPDLVNAWPVVVFAATLIDRIGSAVIDSLTPKP